jgi:MinD superfamily P-loop ATPase
VPVVAVASGKGGVGKTTAGGQPVMVSRAVPQQVAAYEQVAAEVRDALFADGQLAELN